MAQVSAWSIVPALAQEAPAAAPEQDPVPAAPPPAEPTPAPAPEPFRFEAVQALAENLAKTPFKDTRIQLPQQLKDVGYDLYRDFRFRKNRALFADQAVDFRLEFFHLGFLYDRPVEINVIRNGQPERIVPDRSMFEFGGFKGDPQTELGFAGFRIHYPLNKPDAWDELAVFLGASYFRLLGRNQKYGISCRGLAVATGSSKGEEFPFYRAFWIEEPRQGNRHLVVHALLDSPSVTGALRFLLVPGSQTVVETTVTLFARADDPDLGVAPLTSMFLVGENRTRNTDDYRPEVHDSDGLLLHTGHNEWIWRPLDNPRSLRVSAFGDTNPRGFGLMQRDRKFDSYRDIESDFQSRPSLWVEPQGDWGEGAVRLFEIPSESEIHDNMVAFWAPATRLKAGNRLDIAYKLFALLDDPDLPPRARAVGTWLASPFLPGTAPNNPPATRRLVIDFEGPEIAGLDPAQPVEAVVTSSTGRIDSVTTTRIPATGQWRVAALFDPGDARSADLRAFIRLRGEALSETWTCLWTR
ncbi:glucan biosynthesis protein [Zavarzinia sp. CC-PAN008]|uniref:glucan biosynthesis protein n=1 Tax=Zavarzinia sp. CC-PAN008 TaxID=3243332 RepID=UPI003F7439AD